MELRYTGLQKREANVQRNGIRTICWWWGGDRCHCTWEMSV